MSETSRPSDPEFETANDAAAAEEPFSAAEEPADVSGERRNHPSNPATSVPPVPPLLHRLHRWSIRAKFPVRTLIPFVAFAFVLWLNAAINPFRFNVALAVLASIPLSVLLIRGATFARQAARDESSSTG